MFIYIHELTKSLDLKVKKVIMSIDRIFRRDKNRALKKNKTRNVWLQTETNVEASSVLTKVTVEEEKTTVAELLTKLKIPRGKFLAVLVDGKKAELDQEIHEGQKVIILPMIAGG